MIDDAIGIFGNEFVGDHHMTMLNLRRDTNEFWSLISAMWVALRINCHGSVHSHVGVSKLLQALLDCGRIVHGNYLW